MSQQRIITLQPFGWQFQALDMIENNRIVVVAGGRGSGKSNLFQQATIREAFRAPNRKMIYGAQSYKGVREMYLQMLQAPGFRSLLSPSRPYQEQPTICFNFCNGSRLTMLTLGKGQDAGKNLGLEGNWVVLDEAREIAEQCYNDLSPMVSRLRGRTLILSTFKHRSHWFTRLYDIGQTKNDLGIASMKVPSHMGICYQGEEGRRELEKERATRTERVFARDYLCEFVDSDKAVFRKELITRAHVKGLKPATCSKEPTLLCWDLGRRADPAVVLVGDLHGRLLHAEKYKIGVGWDVQLVKTKALADLYNSTVLVESNGTNADSAVQLMRSSLYPHTLRALPLQRHDKENKINRIVFRLEKGPILDSGLQIPDDPMFRDLCQEMEALEYKETPSYVGYHSEIHDDYVSALCVYCEGLHLRYGGAMVGGWNDDKRPMSYH